MIKRALLNAGVVDRRVVEQGMLQRSPSSLSREVAYASEVARQAARARRERALPLPKLHADGTLWGVVSHLLTWLWLPRQIARTLRRMWPDQPERHVSRDTIYNPIYAHPWGELSKALVACLRQSRNTRRPRSGGEDRRGQIPEMVSIHVRPPEINGRIMPGHWEGDLIKGAGNRTNVRVYFYYPHSPWQRGSCKNTNGLLRQMLSKGTDLSVHDQEALDFMADLLNNRLRKTLGWRTPIQIFKEFTQAAAEKSGATIH